MASDKIGTSASLENVTLFLFFRKDAVQHPPTFSAKTALSHFTRHEHAEYKVKLNPSQSHNNRMTLDGGINNVLLLVWFLNSYHTVSEKSVTMLKQ